MNESELIRVLSSIVFASAPLTIAVIGEIITERSGIINLSLDGTMMMAAMTGFVVALQTDAVWAGFLAGALIGMLFALIIAFSSIRLRKSQVAVGFVLTLLGDELSAFLGQNFSRIPGPFVQHRGIPILKDIPILGPIFFDQDIVVYFAILLVIFTWWFLFRTQPGLKLRSAGERPTAAFARGVYVHKVRYLYTIVGGALVGIAGAAYSLDIKVGWSDAHALDLLDVAMGYGGILVGILEHAGDGGELGTHGSELHGIGEVVAEVDDPPDLELLDHAGGRAPQRINVAMRVAHDANAHKSSDSPSLEGRESGGG